MNHVKSILLILAVALLPLNLFAEEKESAIDIPEIVLHHMSDAYEWHIAGHVSIPLPIIVKGENEWFFGTSKGIEQHKTLFFDESHHGKIYEKMSDGSVKRPLDLSMTKTVCQIWIVVIILIVLFLSIAKWYKKRDWCNGNARNDNPR